MTSQITFLEVKEFHGEIQIIVVKFTFASEGANAWRRIEKYGRIIRMRFNQMQNQGILVRVLCGQHSLNTKRNASVANNSDQDKQLNRQYGPDK